MSRTVSLIALYDACRHPLVPILSDISDTHLGWRPAPEARNKGEQMRHLIRVDLWYLRQMGFDPPSLDPGENASAEALRHALSTVQGYIRNLVASCNDQELTQA